MNEFYNVKLTINKQLSSQRLDKVLVSKLEGYRTVMTPEAQLARGVLTTLVLPPSGEVIEVTTFRAELGYEDGTRRPVAVAADTFYEDSLRRDFTMNALGWRLNGTILDYHEGVDDIEFGQLVAVGDASERLKEDPLRILRAVRFASRYGLEIDEELGAAIETNLPQLLTLSPERIRRELDTILKSEEGAYDLVNVGKFTSCLEETIFFRIFFDSCIILINCFSFLLLINFFIWRILFIKRSIPLIMFL